MDIYDKMCFTVSSAGGRRGAQMGTFDVGHPDAMEFIRAKRENGRLRQFNLSLLVTDDFMQAVRADTDWNLAFPLLTKEYDPAEHKLDDATKFVWREWPTTKNYVTREDGLVCCKIYKTLPARRMWDVIMTSTYDFAEPGFILIDRVNEMNNNWWCENIRATNPCVTGRHLGADERGPAPGRRAHRQAVRGARRWRRSRQRAGRVLPHGAQAAGERSRPPKGIRCASRPITACAASPR